MQASSTPDVFIILASQSPRRIDLLEKAGYQFQVVPSQAEESDAEHHNIDDIVRDNARIKAMAVVDMMKPMAGKHPENTVVLAADTLVRMGDKVYGKPVDLDEARSFMKELGGREHEVLTGTFLYNLHDGRSHTWTTSTRVTLRLMNDDEITALFSKVDPLDKAAAYGYQDAPEIVESLEGSGNNVIGLAVEQLPDALSHVLGT